MWARLVWRTSRGNLLDFDERKYLVGIYEDQFHSIIYTKAAQMGLSERLISEAVWVCQQRGKNVLYTFPASEQLEDFTQARLDPVFANSEYLRRVLVEAEDSVQKIMLRTIGKGHLYFRGSQNDKQIISIDADMIVLDERDRFKQESVPFIDKRTLASDLRWRREASTPTKPGMGVHAAFMDSDQRVWQVQCDECQKWQEISFFKNFDHDDFTCKCQQCNAPLNRLKNGRWFIQNPEKSNELHGYKISGVYNPKRTIKEMVSEYYKALNSSTSELEQFYNQVLGEPFQVEGQKITEEQLDACKRDYMYPVQIKGCVAGVDVGSVLNVVIAIKYGEDKARVVWAGVVKDFTGPSDSLEELMTRFDIKMMVIDTAPERRKVKEFIAKYPGRVYAAEYPTKKFTIDQYIIYDDVSKEVKLDRTISLDYLVSDIQNQRIELPQNIDLIENFYSQMTSSVRVTVKNERTGETIAKWIEEKADHFFHAFNYCRIALLKAPGGQALINYLKTPDSQSMSVNQIARWVQFQGQRIF